MLNLPTFLPNEKLVFSAILIVKAFIALEVVHRIFRHLVFGQEAKRLAKAASAYKKHQIEHNDGSASKESQHQETIRDEFALKQFISWCKQGPSRALVTNIEINYCDTVFIKGFTILR